MKTEVIITNSQRKIKVTEKLESLITNACDATLRNEGFAHDAEVNVTLVSDRKIKEYNSRFRGINKSTDVLSFPMGENDEYDVNPENGAYMLGDVVLSLEHAVAQAEEFGHSFEREAAYLTVHSMLHLLGYDHVNDEQERKIMRGREEQVMELLDLRR
ncbi:MAG: rRNA maturation RNase YbeY [Clostridia bacterium]|nr:rRNA maturation RNase YbeY [Clostridia bacterium]